MSRLAFERLGNPENPSLLCLHGYMSSNAQWLANQDALAAHFDLVMVELWGHGRSPEPADPACYSVNEYLHQFETLRGELGIGSWGLIGQSYGAGILLNYAARYPDSCRAIMVTNSRSAFGDITSDKRAPANRPAPASPRDVPLHPINARRFPPEIKAAMVASADAMSMSAINATGRLAGALSSIDLLGELMQPMLLANGIYEKPFQADVARLKAAHPALRVVDLEGGHSVNIEAAADFNKAALTFFSEHLS